MGKPVPGRREENGFVGESAGGPGDDATLAEALQSAAEAAVAAGYVTSGSTAEFDIVRQQVEIGNQHVRTYRVTIVPGGS